MLTEHSSDYISQVD